METEESQRSLLRHVRQLDAEVAELKQEGAAPLADTLAHLLTAHLLAAAKEAAHQAENGCIDLKILRALNADLVALRHGDHSAERLKVEREWLDLETAKFESQSRTKLEIGLDALAADIKKNPRAMEKYKELRAEIAKEAAGADGNLPNLETRRGLSPETLREIEKEAKLL